MTTLPTRQPLRRGTRAGRGALAAVTLGSAMALLDGTVVNLAVPTIGRELGASLAQVQWVVNGYLLSLAALILVSGALGDRVGRRRVYVVGIALFALASLACAVAQDPTQLILARVIQGVGGALLTPGALAVIQASFAAEDRAAAIGTWAGTSGIATALGPFVGGFLLDHGGWRWIFAINLPIAAAVLLLVWRFVPESRNPRASGGLDGVGAVLTVAGLGLLTWGLIGASDGPLGRTVLGCCGGLALLAGFTAYERRAPRPLVPMDLFGSGVFSAANGMTFLVYGALGAVMFFLVVQLQVSSGFSPMASGLASLPVTAALFALSSRAAALGQRIGPRVPMTVGPLVCAVGVAMMSGVGAGTRYWTGVFPGMVLFALGLAALVSPLTAAVLAAAPDRLAGTASGINNAVARAGSLLAVAALPPLVGLTGDAYADPAAFTAGYRPAMLACAALLAGGGIVSWFGLAGTRGRTGR